MALPTPFDVWDGTVLWVTQPRQVCVLSGIEDPNDPGCPETLTVAGLSCNEADAHYTDWNALGPVHLHHPGIIPSRGTGATLEAAVYDVQVINIACDSTSESNFSPALSITNPVWGDIGGLFDPDLGQWTAPDGSIDITTDITMILDAVRNSATSVGKARADLEPCVLDFKVNIISDVVFAIEAFRRLPFPFAPGDGDCPPTPCG